MQIDSPNNATLQEWKKLQTAKGRKAQQRFIVEGEHLVREAVKYGEVESVLLRDTLDPTEYGIDDSMRVAVLSERAFKEISSVESQQGIAAVVKIPETTLDLYNAPRLLALDGVQDPGNVGTLIRTADAAGFSAVLIGQGCADPYAPKTVRSTQGSIFHLPVVPCSLLDVLHPWLAANSGTEKNSAAIVGTDAAAAVQYDEWFAPKNVCLIMGNEGAGISGAVRQLCTEFLSIPIHGFAESLSVSIAGGILMYSIQSAKAQQ